MAVPASPPRGRLTRRAIFWRVVVVLVGALILTVIALLWLLRSVPAYWKQQQAFRQSTPLHDRALFAETAQQRVVNTLANLDNQPDGTVRLSVPFKEANAWLELKLPGWLANQNLVLPPEIGSPMIATAGSDLVLAFELVLGEVTQVVSMSFEPRVEGTGQASLMLKSVRGGRLSLPLELITRKLRGATGRGGDGGDHLASILEGTPFDAHWTTASGRRCTLVGLVVGKEAFDLLFNLESSPRGP